MEIENKSNCYFVKCIAKGALEIAGSGTHEKWNYANCLSSFYSPWDSKTIDKIEFRALYDIETLFFYFKVYDSEVHIETKDNSVESINESDRVELFFRTDDNLNPYYCLEIDPTSRLMDFKAYPNKDFDFNWNWPMNDIKVKSNIGATYFTVEVAISLTSLKDLGLLNKGKIETGIYRAKYYKKESGNYKPTWITWIDPKTAEPNFHIATSFGNIELEDFN